MYAALKGHKITMASIILKWKFGTTKSPPRAGQTAQLAENGLGQGGELPEGQPSLQHSTNQAFYGGQTEAIPVKGT
jgi:hypothetical protein